MYKSDNTGLSSFEENLRNFTLNRDEPYGEKNIELKVNPKSETLGRYLNYNTMVLFLKFRLTRSKNQVLNF